MIAWPVAERASRRRSTPRSAARGSSFSMPTHATWSGGSAIPRSALPSFVQTTTPPGVREGEVRSRDARLRGEERRAQVPARHLREGGRLGEPGLAAETRVEQLADLLLPQVDGRQHDVARRLAAELHDALAEVACRSPRSRALSRCALRPHSSVSIDLLFTTRSAPRSRRIPSTMRVVLGRIRGPVDARAEARGVALELLEILVQAREGVAPDGGGPLAQPLPLGQRRSRRVAARAHVPERGVVPGRALGVAQEASRGGRVALGPGSLTGAAPGRPGSRPRASRGAGPRAARRGRAGGAGSSRRRR